ncbi:MAG: NFACT family protein [Candidatus Melainabacteria bacterium]
MQAIDAITLRLFAAELNTLLTGAKIQKIQHPNNNELVISLWGGALQGDRHLFYINLDPAISACCLAGKAELQDVIITTLGKPTNWCMLLRKHLQNARILGVETVPHERVLNIRLDNFNELGNRTQLLLSLELMGKHSNMLLVDTISSTILGVAHSVSERMSRHRELSAGLPYAPPPPPEGKIPWQAVTPERLAHWQAENPTVAMPVLVNQQVLGIGTAIAQQAWHQASASPESFCRIIDQLISDGPSPGKDPQPLATKEPYGCDVRRTRVAEAQPKPGEVHYATLSADYSGFTLLTVTIEPVEGVTYDNLTAMLHDYVLWHVARRRLQEYRRRMQQALKTPVKKLRLRMADHQPVDAAELTAWQQAGDELLSAYSSGVLPENTTSGRITFTSVFSGEPITLDIDPARSWTENAELAYRRVRKAHNRQAHYETEQARLADEWAYMEELQHFIEQADTLNELMGVYDEMAGRGWLPPLDLTAGGGKPGKKPNPKTGPEVLRRGIAETSLTGPEAEDFTVYIGKSSQANAAMLSRLAQPEDWWLHVQHGPGSHVIVKTGRRPLPESVLEAAARLAVRFSKARQGNHVPVVYTQCKHVRKIPDSYPGHVTYKQEQTLFIAPDPHP